MPMWLFLVEASCAPDTFCKRGLHCRYHSLILLCLLQDKPLACLAYMTGNILSCINDGCARPFREEDQPWTEDQPQDRPANVALVAVAVGNWPFMFVVAIHEIAAGQVGVACKCHALTL